MNSEEKRNLLYRRQFLLTPNQIEDLNYWKKIELTGKYFLYVHPDLPFNEIKTGNKQLILLGEIYDSLNPEFGNMEILKSLVQSNSMEELTKSVYPMAGRYALVFILNGAYYLFNDPSASRKIFYTNNLKVNWCGSQPHVIARYCGIEKSKIEEVVSYYNSKEFVVGLKINVYNNTAYDNIKQLLPNHYLELSSGRHIRFWPNKPLQKLKLKEAVKKASEIITNTVEAFSKRHKLMAAITSGNDTRVILAATKRVASDVYFYINKNSNMTYDNRDLRISRSLIKKLGLEFHIHEYPDEVDKDFKEIYNQNSAFPIEDHMAIIYNIYYKGFQDRVNLPGGFSDISRNFYFTYKKKITPRLLTMMYMMSIQHYVVEKEYFTKNFKIWLDEITEPARKYGYNILDLFNWEERNGNWYTTYQEDKDIAQEEYVPFNNRLFMDVCLAVNKKYRDLNTNVLYKAMVKYMWPEALREIMYPKSWIKYYLRKLGLYVLVRRIMAKY